MLFPRIGQLEFTDPDKAWSAIAEGARTFEAKTSVLERLEAERANLSPEDFEKRKVAVLYETSRNLGEYTFANFSQWLDTHQFSEVDLATLANGFAIPSRLKETGQWLDWASQHVDPEELATMTGTLSYWANYYPKEAEAWVMNCTDPLVREQAIVNYALGAAGSDMDGALRMLALLPDEQKRQEVLDELEDAKDITYGRADKN